MLSHFVLSDFLPVSGQDKNKINSGGVFFFFFSFAIILYSVSIPCVGTAAVSPGYWGD